MAKENPLELLSFNGYYYLELDGKQVNKCGSLTKGQNIRRCMEK